MHLYFVVIVSNDDNCFLLFDWWLASYNSEFDLRISENWFRVMYVWQVYP